VLQVNNEGKIRLQVAQVSCLYRHKP